MAGFNIGTKHPGGYTGAPVTIPSIGGITADKNAADTLGSMVWDNSPDDPNGRFGPALFRYVKYLAGGAALPTTLMVSASSTLAKGNLVCWLNTALVGDQSDGYLVYCALQGSSADATNINVKGALISAVPTANQTGWTQVKGYTGTLIFTAAPAAIGGPLIVDPAVTSQYYGIKATAQTTSHTAAQNTNYVGRAFVTSGTSGVAYLDIRL